MAHNQQAFLHLPHWTLALPCATHRFAPIFYRYTTLVAVDDAGAIVQVTALPRRRAFTTPTTMCHCYASGKYQR